MLVSLQNAAWVDRQVAYENGDGVIAVVLLYMYSVRINSITAVRICDNAMIPVLSGR
jgi:hypothetical protein